MTDISGVQQNEYRLKGTAPSVLAKPRLSPAHTAQLAEGTQIQHRTNLFWPGGLWAGSVSSPVSALGFLSETRLSAVNFLCCCKDPCLAHHREPPPLARLSLLLTALAHGQAWRKRGLAVPPAFRHRPCSDSRSCLTLRRHLPNE